MLSHPIPQNITHCLVEEHIERKSLRLRFDATLEKFFEKETGEERCRYLFRMGLVVLGIFQLVLYPQKLLLGDAMFPKMLLIQWGITTPLALAVQWMLRYNPRPLIRELCVVTSALLVTANCVTLTLMSRSPDRWAMLLLLIIAFLYFTSIQQVRFLPTLVACAGVCALEIYLTLRLPQFHTNVFLACAFITITASVFAAYGNYLSERQTRQAYLLSLLTRIQNAELNRASAYDVLTSLGNRRLLRVSMEGMENSRARSSHAVLMLDIDHFKDLNDHAGHLAGDQCLVRIASLIQSQLRSHRDRAFRYGGEEFVILLENATQKTGMVVAERIRNAIEQAGIPHPGKASIGHVTASIGVAAGIGAISPLLADADAALYAAKRSGRNKVCGKPDESKDASVGWTASGTTEEETTSLP